MEKREYQRDKIRMEEGKEITLDNIEANKYKSQKFPFLNNLVSHNISLKALLGLLKLL